MQQTLWLVALVALLAFAIADVPGTSRFANPTVVTLNPRSLTNRADIDIPVYDLSEEELCEAVGRLSGCSGCELGTKGLCRWAKFSAPVALGKKRAVEDVELKNQNAADQAKAAVSFRCISQDELDKIENTDEDDGEWVGYMCPADSDDEFQIDDPVAISSIVNFAAASKINSETGYYLGYTYEDEKTLYREQTSTLYSHTYDHVNGLGHFDSDDGKLTVDRFSLHGALGDAALLGFAEKFNKQPFTDARYFPTSCDQLLSEDLFTGFPINNDPSKKIDVDYIMQGKVTTEYDRFCLRQQFGLFLSTYCPPYGKAISGICLSFFKELIENCGTVHDPDSKAWVMSEPAEKTAYAPGGDNVVYPQFGMNLWGYKVVADGTAYCLDSLDITPSGKMETFLNLYKYPKKFCNDKWVADVAIDFDDEPVPPPPGPAPPTK